MPSRPLSSVGDKKNRGGSERKGGAVALAFFVAILSAGVYYLYILV